MLWKPNMVVIKLMFAIAMSILEPVPCVVKMELMEECPEWKPLGHLAENLLPTGMFGNKAGDEPPPSECDEEVRTHRMRLNRDRA